MRISFHHLVPILIPEIRKPDHSGLEIKEKIKEKSTRSSAQNLRTGSEPKK
ncbi:MAG: hypothetical protein GY696_12640 [Gammaproteobacteria bacterium]|nr:hypothetical protein [Gammaproteobacteria bacterium]